MTKKTESAKKNFASPARFPMYIFESEHRALCHCGRAIRVNIAMSAAIVSLAFAGVAHGQGTLTVEQTGGGEPLVSDQVLLQTSGTGAPMIGFDFGFVTDESPQPGVFLDSYTVSFEDASADVAVVATIDASGTTWEPVSPGSISLSPGDVQFQTITPPSQAPVSGQGVAYNVLVTLPASFAHSTVTAEFDLFDNENPATSALGWFDDLSVLSVPEPSVIAMAAMGVGTLLASRRFWR